jgi:hypothetical protein
MRRKKQSCCCCKIRGKVHMRKTILLLLDKENLKGALEKKSVPASKMRKVLYLLILLMFRHKII